MKKKTFLFLTSIFLVVNVFSQSKANWSVITDNSTGIKFSLPSNKVKHDLHQTTLYAAAIDSTEAVQVHIFKNATFNNTEPVFNEALVQEAGDTLRAIAKLMILASNSEIEEVTEVFTNGIRGLQIGLAYKTLKTNTFYESFVRYFLIDGNFVSFTWTGRPSNLKNRRMEFTNKNNFFDSININ
jgi:hypothetical protein